MEQICYRKSVQFINTKNIFYLFFISLISNSGYASRARLESLQNKNHLYDTEMVFSLPTKASEFEPFITIESGQTSYLNFQQGAFASGLLQIDKLSSVVISLGRQNELAGTQRVLFNQLVGETFELSQNPIHLIWSTKNYGQSFAFGLFHSAKNDKLNQDFESTEVISGGYRIGFLTLAMAVGLVNEAQTTGAAKKININDSGTVSILYEIDNLALSGSIENFSAIQKNSGVEANSIEYQNFQMALSDRTDFDNNHFFYRVDLTIKNLRYRNTSLKDRQNQLPLTLGIESEFSDWLVLRSSIQQTLLINQSENQPAAVHTTQAAFGAGFKFRDLIVDGTFTGLLGPAQTGELSAQQFLSQVAITSKF